MTRWHGTLVVDAARPERSHATLTADAGSVEVLEGTGGLVGLTAMNRRDIGKAIERKVLRTGDFPEITFVTTAVAGAAPAFAVTGTLALLGATGPLPVTVAVDGTEVVARATFSHAAFGLKPYAALLGAIRLRDDVYLELRLTLPPDAGK
ncbi:MAG: YceI family protein [Actinomycetota bacterium]|nr:YceI family protein [Actinomycetota bacterium]